MKLTHVTKVMGRGRTLGQVLMIGIALAAYAQENASPAEAKPLDRGPAEALYLQLRSVGLDKTRVFGIRRASINRPGFHVALEDGRIAFTEDVAGHITGAFFEGEGEVLLIPPNRVERASLALFTGAAILEERFGTAYFRFNDDTFEELRPTLRPVEGGAEFVTQWDSSAHNLAQLDALRLLMSFSESLPVPGQQEAMTARPDAFWHARIQGRSLGTFDLYYDSDAMEQVWSGQSKTSNEMVFFDVWTSYSPGKNADGTKTRRGGNSGIGVEVPFYKIRAEIKMPRQLTAEAVLTVKVEEGGRRSLLFELSRFLQVKEVEANGERVEFIHNQPLEGTELARLGNDLIAVVLPRPLRTGEQIQLKFTYAGDVLSEAGGGLVYVGARGTWYPNRRPGMSNFDLEFRYPEDWTLIATGRKVEHAAVDGKPNLMTGVQTSHWLTDRPIPIAGFNLGKYEQAVAKAGNVTVTTYAAREMEKTFPQAAVRVDPIVDPPGIRTQSRPIVIVPPAPSPARNAQRVADAAAEAVEFFSRRFGPYPYSTLALTQRPGGMSQGWPGLVFLSSFSFLTEGEKYDLRLEPVVQTMTTAVIAHETAHQWWGDLVGWEGYRDQWIVEALADYSSLMLLESRDPAQFRRVLENYRDDLLKKTKDGNFLMDAGPVVLGSRLSCSKFPSGYEAISYGRGVWLFHMLRSMMRAADRKSTGAAEPFIVALQRLRTRYEGKDITTAEMLKVFEEQLPRPLWYEGRRSLSWFLDDWINGTAVPRFELSDVKYVDKAGGVAVTGNIVRMDAPEYLVTPVPLFAVVRGNRTLIGQVFTEENETPFRLSAPAGTRKIVLDPDHTILTRAR